MNTDTTTVLAVWSAHGGAGRTSLAIALSSVARDAGIANVIVDASDHHDAARHVRSDRLDIAVVDLPEDVYGAEKRLRALELLHAEADLIIVDTGIWSAVDTQFFDGLVDTGAVMLGITDTTTPGLMGLLSRNNGLAETVATERLGAVLNRVPTDGRVKVDEVMSVVSKNTGFSAAVAVCERPSSIDDMPAAAVSALTPTAEKVIAWLGLASDARASA